MLRAFNFVSEMGEIPEAVSQHSAETGTELRAFFMQCRHCNSTNLTFSKYIFKGKVQTQYHYEVKCKDCRKRYKVTRCKEVYDQVKDIPWKFKKRKGVNQPDRSDGVTAIQGTVFSVL